MMLPNDFLMFLHAGVVVGARWVVAGVVLAGLCFARAEEPKPPAAKAKPTNRLAKETSPYLLQHAHNPVDWQPWGEEALAQAKKEGKPIFLSIGYSSCHWCHVMERESFLDEEIAAYLNKHYVCIKVDREERPDLDSIFMTSLQVYNQLAGSRRGGGWPMSMFLTPEGEPFFGGTYFPARDGDRGPSVGFLTVAVKIQEMWTKAPNKLRQDAATIVAATRRNLEGQPPAMETPLTEQLAASVGAALTGEFDEKWGGFGFAPNNPQQPKFPEPGNLVYLLDQARRKPDDAARRMLTTTLEKMAQGGIRDHLGGGFHRYSTDRYWRIPHFEKMLYDNGQLASVYSEAFLLTGRAEFRAVVEELIEFILREMQDASGGFYAALDADSQDEEGMFYRWERAEAQKLLTAEEYELFASVYGLGGGPNFEEKFYVPQLAHPVSAWAEARKLKPLDLEAKLRPIRQKLLAARGQRPRPLTDTKILTGENGLMIGGLADAGRCLKVERYVQEATRAADFILAKLRTADGRLLRTYSASQAKLNAYVTDYAYLVEGSIALYRATGDKKWLTMADELMAKQIELFQDKQAGGFFFTSGDHETLLARTKEMVDSAVPSGNSVSAGNLLFLANELKKDDYLAIAEKTIAAAAPLLESSPAAATRTAVNIRLLLDAKAKTAGKKP